VIMQTNLRKQQMGVLILCNSQYKNTFYREYILFRTHSIVNTFYSEYILH